MVGPFVTDEEGGVVRTVHLMYRCNKGNAPANSLPILCWGGDGCRGRSREFPLTWVTVGLGV